MTATPGRPGKPPKARIRGRISNIEQILTEPEPEQTELLRQPSEHAADGTNGPPRKREGKTGRTDRQQDPGVTGGERGSSQRAGWERKSREREQAEAALARDAGGEDIEMMATGDSLEQAMLEMAESPMEDVSGCDLGEGKHAPQIATGGAEVTYLTNGAATDGLEQARIRRNRRDRAKGKGKVVIRPFEINNTPRTPAAMRQNIAALTQPPAPS